MREFQINSNEAGQRFDKYLKKLLSNAPGSFVYKMLRKKNIVLNGKKAYGTEKLSEGDQVKLFLADDTFEKFSGGSPERILSQKTDVINLGDISVVYENEDILIINKPLGVLSQKSAPEDVSVNEWILSYLIEKGELNEEMLRTFRPSICNRLDRNTSGLLAVGKTLKGLQALSAAFKERTVQKYYRCIVNGEVKKEAYIKGWLVKDKRSNQVKIYQEKPMFEKNDKTENNKKQKKDAQYQPQYIETEYRPVRVKNGYSELEVHLLTGRSHQIRAHLASVGHPIIGDLKYGNKNENEKFRNKAHITSQLLHSYRMEFEDGLIVMAESGEEFKRAWEIIEKQ